MRLGTTPRVLATTTPRNAPLMRLLLADAKRGKVVVARGKTVDNREILPADYFASMIEQFSQSGFGRQELDGEMVEASEGALWDRALIETCRESAPSSASTRIVIGVDPPASAKGDACGIVVCALGEDAIARVLADMSVERASPERWARAVARAAKYWSADRVIAEANQGGAMVESVLRAAEQRLPVKLVHASRGKAARAEPVAALYEAGRVAHRGAFPELEDEMCGLLAGGGYVGPGRSPDRADALVWAMSELMLGKMGEARVRGM